MWLSHSIKKDIKLYSIIFPLSLYTCALLFSSTSSRGEQAHSYLVLNPLTRGLTIQTVNPQKQHAIPILYLTLAEIPEALEGDSQYMQPFLCLPGHRFYPIPLPAPDTRIFLAQLHLSTLAVLTLVHDRGHAQVEFLQNMTQPGRCVLHTASSSSMGLTSLHGAVQNEVMVPSQQGRHRSEEVQIERWRIALMSPEREKLSVVPL